MENRRRARGGRKGGNNRRKTQNLQPRINRQTRFALQRAIVQSRPPRYIDTTVSGSIVLAGSLNQITDVAQGVGQGQRTGDRILLDHFIWNYTLYQENADVVNTVRLMVVQYITSTTLAAPAVVDFLQSATPTSFYNHELQKNYYVLYDRAYRMAGINTAPTATSAIGRQNVIIRPRAKVCDFSLASTTGGTNQCFVLLIGDSTISPYVSITSVIRVVYRNGD